MTESANKTQPADVAGELLGLLTANSYVSESDSLGVSLLISRAVERMQRTSVPQPDRVEEIRAEIQSGFQGHTRDTLQALACELLAELDAARAELSREREECAQIADTVGLEAGQWRFCGDAEDIAYRIRQRNQSDTDSDTPS